MHLNFISPILSMRGESMRADSKLIEFLSNGHNYPEEMGLVEHLETHISHVFVGRDVVYKIKKPVNLGFLNFSLLPMRRFFCRKEVLLNSRLAPGIYLTVVRIYAADRVYSFDKRKGGTIAEYAVKMKRLPEERLLSALIAKGRLLPGSMGDIGTMIARFHREARVSRMETCGTAESVRINTEENFEQISHYTTTVIDEEAYSRVVRYTRNYIAEHEQVFAERKNEGYIREGHGDLHTHHVYLVNPAVIIDCIEFSERLRAIDVLEDTGFLIMDLEYAGRFDLSVAFQEAYFSGLEGTFSESLLRFYKTYRAVVRAKIECLTADSLEEEDPKKAALKRARDYFSLAGYYIERDCDKFNPVIVMGVSGSGKSAIAEGLLEEAIVLRSDEVRKELTGLSDQGHAYAGWSRGIYTTEITQKTYRTIADRAIRAVKEGRRVVVDAAFLFASQRQEFYRRCADEGINPFFIYCNSEPQVLRRRVERRMMEGQDISDAHLDILEHQLKAREEPDELPCFRVLKLDTSEEPDRLQRALRSFL
jgi:uncharacterized protein